MEVAFLKVLNITSPHNELIVKIKKLKIKKYREKENLFIAEGVKNVNDSMKYTDAQMIFALDVNLINTDVSCPVYIVTEKVMKEISDTVTPQGLVAVFKIKAFLEETTNKILVLNGVSDPGNVGTILRTACAFGFDTVIADENTADIYSPKVVRSAMSAVFSLNILRTRNLVSEINSFKEKGYTFYVSYLGEGAEDIKNISFSEKPMLAVGSEANGVSNDVLMCADKTYIIPMNENIESLNVGIAAAISMFECLGK